DCFDTRETRHATPIDEGFPTPNDRADLIEVCPCYVSRRRRQRLLSADRSVFHWAPVFPGDHRFPHGKLTTFLPETDSSVNVGRSVPSTMGSAGSECDAENQPNPSASTTQ